jgi:hypothetical protein
LVETITEEASEAITITIMAEEDSDLNLKEDLMQIIQKILNKFYLQLIGLQDN